MSYILDALKKSDEQRQRGATPTLPPTQPAPAGPKLSYFAYYGSFYAVVLLCAGIAIGWWHPWRVDQPVPVAEPNNRPATRPDQPAMASKPEQKLPAPNIAPAVPAFSPKEPVIPATTDQEQKATPFADLPLAIQQEIPEMKIQLHSYSNKSANSIVSINSRMMKEGDSLAPGLKLEQITPDGVILSYKGYRFQHGIY
jgi:general secretion pathway protein B